MRAIKAALFGSIVVSLALMWSSRHSVIEAYEQTPDSPELRLGGVDLAVTRSEVDRSPFLVPNAPDTRRRPLPALALVDDGADGGLDDVVVDGPPPVEMSGGTSRLRGSVVGPDGPIAEAVVSIERHTSHGSGSLRVISDAEGRWRASGLPGGRYRVRAWVPGLMTMDRSEVVFVSEQEVVEFGFSLWGVNPEPTMEFIHGGPIYDGLSGTVALVVSGQAVDGDGYVVTTPVVGASVAIAAGPEVTITSSPIQLTDAEGAARFVLACIPATAAPTPSPSDGDDPVGETAAGLLRGSTAGSRPPASATTETSNVGLNRSSRNRLGRLGRAAPVPQVGMLTASSGELVGTYPLPGCVPVPPPDVPDPDEAAEVDGADGADTDG